MSELDVLIDQMDELLGEGIIDGSDALEFAMVAGLAARLGASPGAMEAANAWRTGPGAPLLDEIWAEVDPSEFVESLTACLEGDFDEAKIEEALLDFDELVAAAIWCRQIPRVRAAAAEVSDVVRDVPEAFAALAEMGVGMARSREVAEWAEVYAFWFAVADAGRAG